MKSNNIGASSEEIGAHFGMLLGQYIHQKIVLEKEIVMLRENEAAFMNRIAQLEAQLDEQKHVQQQAPQV